MIYFEDARLEFFGVPLAYFPYISAPDPTVKRKSGFLMPIYSIEHGLRLRRRDAVLPGAGARLRPDHLAARHVQAGPADAGRMAPALRGRLLHDPRRRHLSARPELLRPYRRHTDPGLPRLPRQRRDARAGSTSRRTGSGAGTASLVSDPTFFQDYKIRSLQLRTPGSARYQPEHVDRRHLAALSGRPRRPQLFRCPHHPLSRLLRAPTRKAALPHHSSGARLRSTLWRNPILGGELGYSVNLTSLSRAVGELRPDQPDGDRRRLCSRDRRSGAQDTGQLPAARHSRRLLARLRPRRIGAGKSSTPSVRCSRRSRRCAATSRCCRSTNDRRRSSNFIHDRRTRVGRVHADGRFRIPLSVHRRAVVGHADDRADRPGHRSPGRDRISASCRTRIRRAWCSTTATCSRSTSSPAGTAIEGGGRVNVGLQYTAQFNRGGFVNVLFGQSYQLFGVNSFAVGDVTNTGLGSGLDKRASDYVARVSYQPNRDLRVHLALPLRRETTSRCTGSRSRRAPISTAGICRCCTATTTPSPQLGFLTAAKGDSDQRRRSRSTPTGSLTGAARYDIDAQQDSTRPGLRRRLYRRLLHHVAELHHRLHLQHQRARPNHTVMLQLSLRTLGGARTCRCQGQSRIWRIGSAPS